MTTNAPLFYNPSAAVPEVSLDGLTWYDADDERFRLEGFYWRQPHAPFRRLPLSTHERTIPDGVDGLAWHTAGGQLHLRTDATRIVIHARAAQANVIVRMAMTGTMGFDIYADGVFQGLTRFKVLEPEYDAELFTAPTRRLRNLTINFPLFARLDDLRIGIDSSATFEPPRPWPDPRPIVAYGTSILHGACANRPGMAYPSQLSRLLNRPVLNFGFAGKAKGEPVMAQTLADIANPALYILDYDANVSPQALQDTLPDFVRTLRAAHPDTPILELSRTPFMTDAPADAEQPQWSDALQTYERIHRQNTASFRASGDRHIHFLQGTRLLGDDWADCLVDGIHANDLGFYRMAHALAPEIRRLLDR